MNSRIVVLHPLDVGLVIGRVRPDSHDYRGKALVPVSEGGLVGADPLSGAVDWMEMHGRTHVRCLPAVLDVSGDRLVGELGDKVGFPVMLHAFWDDPVEGALQGRERHDLDLLRFHLGNVAQWLERLFGLFVWAVPARDQYAIEIPDPVLGDERQRRSYLPAEEASELFRRFGNEFAVALQDRGGSVELIEQRAAHDIADLVQLKLEAGDDPEVAAAAAQGPEQIFVPVIACS